MNTFSKVSSVSDPATATGFGVALSWKAVSAFGGAGAALATIIVMLMMRPRSAREWAVALISTVVGSIAGGAALIMHYDLQSWFYSYPGLIGVLGLAFACGLPAWAVVRWVFNYIEKRRDASAIEVYDEVRSRLP